MGRAVSLGLALAVACSSFVAAQSGRTTGAKSGSKQLTTELMCAADLGAGVKSKRPFCDVIIAATGAESVTVTIPPHTGPATLMFDLHNRFTVGAGVIDPAQAYVRYAALVAVVRPTGQIIGRAAVLQEFRTVQDLFDRISGGGRPSGLKAVAPGQPQAAKATIPAGISSVGIVGVRLEATNRAGSAVHESPGRAIAIVSNIRVEFVPR
jgi:hypothetical protein